MLIAGSSVVFLLIVLCIYFLLNGNSLIWVNRDGEQELWTKKNEHLSWGKPKTDVKGCSVKEEQKQEERGGGGVGEEGEELNLFIVYRLKCF